MTQTPEEMITKMYDSQLASQKAQLGADHAAASSDLDAQKQKNQAATDANLTRTAVESQKAAVNNAEYYAAAGLSSGAKAQAKLAQGNQLQSDMTALRAAQQESDAEIERQRGILGREYSAAISKAQAENDMAKAKALYEQAQKEEDKLLAKEEAAANAMAQIGDFTRFGSLYGMTEQEIAGLAGDYQAKQAKQAQAEEEAKAAQAAQLMAQAGDFSGYQALYGLTAEQTAQLASLWQKESGAADEATRRAQQEAAAQIMASIGDFSLMGSLYGLSPEQTAALAQNYTNSQKPDNSAAAAQAMASIGDFSLLGKIYGLTDEQVAALNENYANGQKTDNSAAAAELMAGAGDFSRLGALYGLSPEEVATLQAAASATGTGDNSEYAWEAAKILAEHGDYSLMGAFLGLSDDKVNALNAGTTGNGGKDMTGLLSLEDLMALLNGTQNTVPEEPTTYPTVPVPVTTTTANGPGKTNRNSLLDGITLR